MRQAILVTCVHFSPGYRTSLKWLQLAGQCKHTYTRTNIHTEIISRNQVHAGLQLGHAWHKYAGILEYALSFLLVDWLIYVAIHTNAVIDT